MSAPDPRLLDALGAQLADRRAALEAGAEHVGWKLGMGQRERIGGHIAVGYLTSATVLRATARYRGPPGELHADVEAAIQLGSDRLEAARFGLAIEIVDLTRQPGEPESAVAGNVFHRAVRIEPLRRPPAAGTLARISVNGAPRGGGQWPSDLDQRLANAASVLDAVGEGLRAGDWIITGAIEQVPIRLGDVVVAELDDVSVAVEIGA